MPMKEVPLPPVDDAKKVVFYAYYCGLMSSRKIWDGLKSRADFIFLSGDQVPDFRTINDFHTRHMKALPKLFAQIMMICRRRRTPN